MGSNRKQPFGYKMEFGRIVIHPEEAEAVRYLFREYNQGKSFLALTKDMQERGIPYDGDKPWNKNMVARILADGRYTGLPPYPLLIPFALFGAVTEKRVKRSAPIQQSPAQKLLRQKCNCSVSPEIEAEVLVLLNKLIQSPALIQAPDAPSRNTPAVTALEGVVDDLLRQLPVDEEAAVKACLDLASARYAAIGSGEYETQRLRHLVQGLAPMDKLDAELVRQSIQSITVDRNGVVKITLKNRQIIGKENVP